MKEVNNITVFEATDGKRFLNRNDCEAYEKELRTVENHVKSISKKVQYFGEKIYYFGCDDDLIICEPKNENDIDMLNRWFNPNVEYNKNYAHPGEGVSKDYIGEKIFFAGCNGCEWIDFFGNETEFFSYLFKRMKDAMAQAKQEEIE